MTVLRHVDMKKYIRKAHRALKIATLCDDPEEEDIFIFISAYFRHRALQNKPRRFRMLTTVGGGGAAVTRAC
jgi:hypothetical protein